MTDAIIDSFFFINSHTSRKIISLRPTSTLTTYDMYRELNPNANINEIMCIPFENLRLNDKTYEKCVEVFKNDILDDATIIYSPSEEGIVVLGYYVLDSANMVTSKYYESLRSAMKCFCDKDETNRIRNTECVHIKTWVFDNALRNKAYLNIIISCIIHSCPYERKHILWYDNSQGEICFYPISRGVVGANISALTYFTNDFMNQ